eukprot:518705-Pelagomonas_calceolata.AAC.7
MCSRKQKNESALDKRQAAKGRPRPPKTFDAINVNAKNFNAPQPLACISRLLPGRGCGIWPALSVPAQASKHFFHSGQAALVGRCRIETLFK